MDINLKDVQKWYAEKINKQVIELDSFDLFCAKVAHDYVCEHDDLIGGSKRSIPWFTIGFMIGVLTMTIITIGTI